MSRKPKVVDSVPVPAAPPAPVAKPMRLLLNPANGRILPWTPNLAERTDLVECSADGIPLRPVARKLARQAELEAQEREMRVQALGGQTLVTEVKDTFGAPPNPAEPPPADNSDLDDPAD